MARWSSRCPRLRNGTRNRLLFGMVGIVKASVTSCFNMSDNNCRIQDISPMARSTSAVDYQNVPRPVAAMARDLPPDHEIAWHMHPRFQVIYATEGVMRIDTHDETWVVPPMRAIWMPPKVAHRVRTSGKVKMRTLYIRTDASERMPSGCQVLPVTPLLRELIQRATEMPVEYDEEGA